MILDGFLLAGATATWAMVLWFYGRAEYREPRYLNLLALASGAIGAMVLIPFGWLGAAPAHYFVLQRLFDFPRAAALTMTASLVAVYMAVWVLFAFAGAAPPPL